MGAFGWRLWRAGLVLVLIGLVWMPTPAAPVQAQDAVAWEVLNAVNQARAQAGLGPLTMNGALVAAAQRHSSDMAANQFLGHTGSDGSSASQRISEAGYSWATVGENAAQTWSVSAGDVVGLWLGSDGHRANILNPAFIDMGLAYATASNGAVYYTQTFGAQPGAVPPAAQAPPTNTPVPPPTSTPIPPSTNTPVPPPTSTPIPPPTNTPIPPPTSTPRPLPTNTPRPAPTNTPVPPPADTSLESSDPLPANTLPPTFTPALGVTQVVVVTQQDTAIPPATTAPLAAFVTATPQTVAGSPPATRVAFAPGQNTGPAAPGVIMLMEEPGIPWTLWFQRLPQDYRPVNAQGIELLPEDGIPPDLWFQVPPALN